MRQFYGTNHTITNDTSMRELSINQIEQYSKKANQMNITWAIN